MSRSSNDIGRPGALRRSRSYRFRAAIFDLDGVIVDSLPVMRAAFAAAYREIVGPGEAPFEEYRKHLGLFFPDIMLRMGLPAEMYPSFVRESALRLAQVRVYPGVRAMTGALVAAGVPCTVATGKSGERARMTLGAVRLLDQFEIVRGADEVSRPKPAPDILLSLLHELSLQPTEAVFVGDALADYECSRLANVPFAVACWGDGVADGLREHADLRLEAPHDLLAALNVAHA